VELALRRAAAHSSKRDPADGFVWVERKLYWWRADGRTDAGLADEIARQETALAPRIESPPEIYGPNDPDLKSKFAALRRRDFSWIDP
jgi:hypothetical protein